MPTKFFKAMTQPIGGMSLFALIDVSLSSLAVEQLPPLDPEQLQQTPAVNNSTQLQTAYILGGGDRLFIDIFQVPQYSGEHQISVDGVLYVPLVAGISVRDLTLVQATKAISAAYARFLQRPLVTVRLLAPRQINVFVSGEVNTEIPLRAIIPSFAIRI